MVRENEGSRVRDVEMFDSRTKGGMTDQVKTTNASRIGDVVDDSDDGFSG